MATADATNTKQLPTFSNTKPFEQMAVQLWAEGVKYQDIVNTINAEFSLAYKESTMRLWFMAGGRLEQAALEYNEALADAAVVRAKLKIKKSSEKAANTLDDLMNDTIDARVRQQAAKTVLGKYIPDRQVIIDESKADDLPSAIGDAGDELLSGDENGQDQVVDTPAGEPASEEPGPGSS